MNLTCVLIIAVLFLTACQLLTADDSRDKQKYRAVRLGDAMRIFKTREKLCGELYDGCHDQRCCPGLTCDTLFQCVRHS
uniref:G084 VD Superfamily O1 precursor conopeptide n=1 Tax=Conus geographus TaxID=6491 RepID=X5IA06_CONGE|nr:G084_VD_Superfamily_O1_precursor_conopeptide [Conus geographus]